MQARVCTSPWMTWRLGPARGTTGCRPGASSTTTEPRTAWGTCTLFTVGACVTEPASGGPEPKEVMVAPVGGRPYRKVLDADGRVSFLHALQGCIGGRSRRWATSSPTSPRSTWTRKGSSAHRSRRRTAPYTPRGGLPRQVGSHPDDAAEPSRRIGFSPSEPFRRCPTMPAHYPQSQMMPSP